jgi:hypothetical protein
MHWAQCDSTGIHDHWSMGDRLTSLAYGKHHILLPQLGPPADSAVWQQNGLRSIFYGEIPCLWQTGTSGTAQPTSPDGCLPSCDLRLSLVQACVSRIHSGESLKGCVVFAQVLTPKRWTRWRVRRTPLRG